MKDNKIPIEQDAPIVHWRLDQWFPDLSLETKAQLKTYHEELIKFNRTTNLISGKTLFVADALHFADSIYACNLIRAAVPTANRIVDFGSGAGFPGLIFALLFPNVQVVLVEVDPKKIEFLNLIATTLKIKNVSIEHTNVESLPENSVTVAMCRGLATISRTLLVARKLMPKGAVLFHLKGEEWAMEVTEIPSQLCSLWSPSLVGEYKLPGSPVKFGVVKTEKIQ